MSPQQSANTTGDTISNSNTGGTEPDGTPLVKRQFIELEPKQGEKRSFLGEWRMTYLLKFTVATEQMACKQTFDDHDLNRAQVKTRLK